MAENSEKTPKVRKKGGPGRPFQKGVAANPGGRPKELAQFRKDAQAVSDIALEALVGCLVDPDGRTRVAAAKEILDRAWGRPSQAITGADGSPLIPSTDVLEAIRRLGGTE